MVLCLLALPVFAILGIFSVKYRKLTLDALDCLFRTATFRKCKSGLDNRIKADLTGKVLKLSPKIAKFFYTHYRIISWAILIIFLWSFYTSSVGVYNYINYGNCNGPESTDFCIFDPAGQYSGTSGIDVAMPAQVVLPDLEDDDPIIGNPDAELTIIEFGCYSCPFTKRAEPTVREVLEHYNGRVNVQFKTFFIPHHPLSINTSLAANCAKDQGKYKEYHDKLFELQENMTFGMISELAEDLGLNMTVFNECFDNEKYKNEVEGDSLMGIHAGVAGTPTFFINGQKIVGPKPFKTFKKIIDKELKQEG